MASERISGGFIREAGEIGCVFRARIFLPRHQTSKEIRYVAIFSVLQKISVKSTYNFLEFGGIFVLVQDFLA